MKIELKNIHYLPQLSEETSAFSADVYINNIKAGAASNRGTGGPTDYYPINDVGKKLIREAEAYCEKLPAENFTYGEMEYTIDMNLEHYIDNLLHKNLEEKELQKFRKKAENAMGQNIVVGIPDESFRTLGLKFPVDLILVHPNGSNVLKDMLAQRVLPNLKENEQILNTNIPIQILKDAGLTDKQFVHPPEQKAITKAAKKKKGRGI